MKWPVQPTKKRKKTFALVHRRKRRRKYPTKKGPLHGGASGDSFTPRLSQAKQFGSPVREGTAAPGSPEGAPDGENEEKKEGGKCLDRS